MNIPLRRAFTVVELLVVIAVVGLIVALLLPAINAARESARRTQCSNNLKQVAAALLNAESTHGRSPAGMPTSPGVDGPSWEDAIGILAVFTLERRGNLHDDARDKGIWKLGTHLGTRASQVTGGMSQTLLVSEVLSCTDPSDLRGAWTCGAMGAAAFSAFAPPNAEPGLRVEHPRFPSVQIVFGDQFFGCGRACDYLLSCKNMLQDGNHYASARSAHPGGVLAARADGSVDFFADDIDLIVWQDLASRR